MVSYLIWVKKDGTSCLGLKLGFAEISDRRILVSVC